MKVCLAGIGMGSKATMTEEVSSIIAAADIVIGAERMVRSIEGKRVFISYKPDEIADIIDREKPDTAAVLLSGDVGFYSGAKRLAEVLSQRNIEVVMTAGISSLVYFCARLGMPWQDVHCLSLHGTRAAAVQFINRYAKTFILLGSSSAVNDLARSLTAYGLGDVTLYVGQNLSYSEESIVSCRASEIDNQSFEKLSVVLAVNPKPFELGTGVIADELFVRGKVPMTKGEVRAVSLAKLALKPDSVLYDVGAGTGAVSVDAALKMPLGKVYAIEKNTAAVELCRQNALKFAADNIEIIEGEAPEALSELPAPTHAFIGGSGGNMRDIISCVLSKNKAAKIVINIISLTTLSEVVNMLDELGLEGDIVSLSCAKQQLAGKHRLMLAQNPVYVVAVNGGR